MPHTYPSPALRRHDTPHQSGKTHSPLVGNIPPRPPMSPNNSRYLSPHQQARILSWRSNTTSSLAFHGTTSSPSSHSNPNKVKSAPASLNLINQGFTTGGSIVTSACPACAAKSICSCSTAYTNNPSKSPRTGSRQRGYYSNKNKKTSTTMTSLMSPPGPVTPATNTPAQSKSGQPTADQVRAHAMGTPPIQQFGTAPAVAPPEVAVAVPPSKPDLPRIAGVRDPISQN